MPRNTRAAAGQRGRRRKACRDAQEGDGRRLAQRLRHLLEPDRDLGDAGAQVDERTWQEQQHVAEQQDDHRLVERLDQPDRHAREGERHDDAGQGAGNVVGGLERPARPRAEADDEDRDRQREDDGQDRATAQPAAVVWAMAWTSRSSVQTAPPRAPAIERCSATGRRPPGPGAAARSSAVGRPARPRRIGHARPRQRQTRRARSGPHRAPRSPRAAGGGSTARGPPASDAAAGPLKVERYCCMIAVVKVSKRSIANAPYSASRWSPTSSDATEDRQPKLGQDHAVATRRGSRPRLAPTSSRVGSSRRSVATTGR